MITKPIYSIIFLPMVLFIGFKTVTEDRAISKIKNKWILMGILYAILIYCSFGILSIFPLKDNFPFLNKFVFLVFQDFDKFCINFMVSILVAFFLWHNQMWGAGDAKLFICYSALIPIGQYQRFYFGNYFASFSLLLAIFIPATIFFALKALIEFIRCLKFFEARKNMLDEMKKKYKGSNIKKISSSLFGFFVFFLFFRLMSQFFVNFLHRFLSNDNIVVIISLLAFKQLSDFFQKNIKFIIIIFIVTLLWAVASSKNLVFGFIFNKELLKNILSVAVVFPFVKKLLNDYDEKDSIKTTAFAHWMFLGALITWFF